MHCLYHYSLRTFNGKFNIHVIFQLKIMHNL